VLMSTTTSGPCLTANARFLTPVDKLPQETEAITSSIETCADIVDPHVCRAKFVDTICECMNVAANVAVKSSSWLEDIRKHLSQGSSAGLRRNTDCITEEELERLKGAMRLLSDDIRLCNLMPSASSVTSLLEDIEGQAAEAVSKGEYFRKWGRHYLPSLMFAHRLQQCNNFKDPGVQGYGGSLFEEVRDRADENFNKLPAPKPSVRRNQYAGGCGGASAAPRAAPVDMSAYNNRYGG